MPDTKPVQGENYIRPSSAGQLQSLVTVFKVDGDNVEFSLSSGGLVKKGSAKQFMLSYRHVSAREIQDWSSNYRPAQFSGDWFPEGTKPLEGYTNGETWNGWARPCLTREAMEAAIKADIGFNSDSFFDEKTQNFVTVSNESLSATPCGMTREEILGRAEGDDWSFERNGDFYQTDVWPAVEIFVDSKPVTVYPLGGSWCWEEHKPEPEPTQAPGI